jgi:hypothetical protein
MTDINAASLNCQIGTKTILAQKMISTSQKYKILIKINYINLI